MGRFRTLAVLGVLLGSSPLVGSACSGNTVTSGTGTVASVTINGLATPVAVGATRQLTVVLRDADGNTLEARPVQWSSNNTAVATVNASTGLLAGVAAGTATITASYQGIEGTAPATVGSATPPGGGTVDPTLLPVASAQRPATSTYGRALNAGQTYRDPLTNVTVLKVTDARTPRSNTGVYGNYSEGGPYISQAWTGADGKTYYTLWLSGDDGWFVDVQYPALTLGNWRPAPVSGETGGAWSLNPATPRIFFHVDGNTLNRFDTGTMALANTAGFPFTVPAANGSNLLWLQTQVNDTWLVGMMGSNNTVVGYRPGTGTARYVTRAASGLDIDEPHIDREQPVVYISAGGTDPQNVIYNLNTGTRTNPSDTQGIVNDDHNAPMRGKIVGVSWKADATVVVDWQGRVTKVPGISPTNWNGDFHTAGQWVFDNPSEYFLVDQWQTSGGSWPIQNGMIGLQSIGGDVRLLVAHDGTGGGYQTGGQPHPTFSPDGRLMFFTSNMNGSSRYDVFLAKLPTR